MALAEVVTLYDTNCRDIPEMLKGLAEAVELERQEGIQTETVLAIQLTDGGAISIYGFGDADNFKALALLQLAITRVSNDTLGWE